MRYFNSIYKIIILFLLTSCAIQVGPEGGPKDTIPPLLTRTDPKNQSVNFNRDKINLYFNEYVGIQNPSQEIIISPLINPQPKITVKKKGIQIKFENKLKDSTTYTIQFGRSIADITETNILADFTYVFSTGPELDSLKLSGNVRDIQKNVPLENIKVMLHQTDNDSSIFKNKPDYYAKSSKKGEFSLSNLHKNSYKIYALDDENGNYLFDKGERIAFTTHNINLTTDSSKIDLELFKEKEEKLRAIDYGVKERNKFYIDFNAQVDSIKVYQIDKGKLKPIKSNLKIIDSYDSAYFWIFPDRDSLQFKLDMWGENYSTDTLLINIRTEKSDKKNIKNKKPSKLSLKLINNLYTSGRIFIDMNEPLTSIDKSKIEFYIDTVKVSTLPDLPFTDSSYTRMAINYPFEYEKNYRLLFNKGCLNGFDTITNDSTVFSLKSMKETDLGILSVDIQNRQLKPVIVQLTDNSYKVLRENKIRDGRKMVYKNLLPGTYRIRCIIDANENGVWDTGNLLKKRQPEKMIYFKDEINLKANWELSDLQIIIP